MCDQGLWRVLVSVWGDENVQKKKEKKRRGDWLVGVEGRVPEVLKRTEKGKKEGKGKGKGKGKGREKRSKKGNATKVGRRSQAK